MFVSLFSTVELSIGEYFMICLLNCDSCCINMLSKVRLNKLSMS